MTVDYYVSFDIETVVLTLSQEDVDRIRQEYRPPANFKVAETIERHREESVKTYVDDNKFKINGCRPIAAGITLVSRDLEVLSTNGFASDDSIEVASWWANQINSIPGHNLKLLGYNIKNFDLPILSSWIAKAGTSLKRKLGKWGVVDLLEYPLKGYKLKKIAPYYGVKIPSMDGSGVAALHRDGDWESILAYVKADALCEAELFIALSRTYDFS